MHARRMSLDADLLRQFSALYEDLPLTEEDRRYLILMADAIHDHATQLREGLVRRGAKLSPLIESAALAMALAAADAIYHGRATGRRSD